MMKTEGIECLEGELLLVKLQNASCEGLDGQVQQYIQTLLFVDVVGLSFFFLRGSLKVDVYGGGGTCSLLAVRRI